MELDKTKNILHIATGDYDLIKELTVLFNKVYNTNIIYITSTDIDGVMFSYLDVTGVDIDKIFLFGAMFGSKVRELRDNNKIDW